MKLYYCLSISIYLICFVFISYGEERISSKKCKEYSRILKQISPQNLTKNVNNGLDAAPKQLPFMGIIGYGVGILAYWLCGGTLISPRYVLSGAHCAVDKRVGKARMVWLGDLVLGTMEDDAHTNIIDIDKKIIHPKYKEGSREYDLALFQLQFDYNPTLYIRPACLNPSETMDVIAPGWGVQGDAFFKSMKLKVGHGKVVSDAKCKEAYKAHPLLTSGQVDGICVSAAPPSTDMCYSDLGGALLASMKVEGYEMWTIKGISAIIKNCSSEPVLYTNIQPHLDWIESVAWSDEDSP